MRGYVFLKICKYEAYFESSSKYKMGIFAKIFNDLNPFTIFEKRSIVNVPLGFKYASASGCNYRKISNIKYRPVNEWRAIALECAHTGQYLFRRVIVARAKLYITS